MNSRSRFRRVLLDGFCCEGKKETYSMASYVSTYSSLLVSTAEEQVWVLVLETQVVLEYQSYYQARLLYHHYLMAFENKE